MSATRSTRIELARDRQHVKRVAPGTGSRLMWYWNRLCRMSILEIGYRAGQILLLQIQKRGFATASVVAEPNLATRPRPFIPRDQRVSVDRYTAAADRYLAGNLPIFAGNFAYQDLPSWNTDPKTGRVAPLVFGKTLNYRDNDIVGDIKYLWEPNRHLQLVTLAQAYHLTGEQRYLDGLRAQLESWLDQCPYLLGPHWTSSLELAIRLINWSVVWQLIDGADSVLFFDRRGQMLRERWLASIYQHAHFIRGHLSRFSSANNHLIGELAGIYIAGHTWPFWREVVQWRQYAKRHLTREALIQNTTDGVNREQAISYQQFVLDFMLVSALAGRANADDFSVAYWQRAERMLEFIAGLMDSAGNVPMIGDADDGYVVRLSQESGFCPFRSLLATGAVLFNRGDFKFKAGSLDDKTRWLLGSTGARKLKELAAERPVRIPRHFPEGGYYVLGCDLDSGQEIRIVADAGALGYRSIAAHGHADALAFTLSIAGHEFLIDPGTYCYHTQPEWRDYFRGTAAHNTVRVDGEDQSVKGGSFLWLQHARAICKLWETGKDIDRFVGEHDGYRRLNDPVIHRRELTLDKNSKRLEIVDVLECKMRHTIEQRWHFAEDVAISMDAGGTVTATKRGYVLSLRPAGLVDAGVYKGSTNPRAGWVSRAFDVKTESNTVVWRIETVGTLRLTTIVECVSGSALAAQPRIFSDSVV